jgi:hypothetical protein
MLSAFCMQYEEEEQDKKEKRGEKEGRRIQ